MARQALKEELIDYHSIFMRSCKPYQATITHSSIENL
jgi:hypothetical protein